MKDKPTVGITGATGFVGRNLVQYLAKNGFKVVALGRSDHSALYAGDTNVEFIRGDLKNLNDVKHFISKIDACVHLASVLAEDDNNRFSDNVQFIKNLSETILAINKNIRLVNISTLAVFNFTSNRYLERTKYAHSKLIADQALSPALNFATIYLGLVYGPGDRYFLPVVINGLSGFKICGIPFRVLMLKGSKKNSPLIFVEDACQLIQETLISSSAKGEKILGVGNSESLYDCVCTLARVLKLKRPVYLNTKIPFLLMANIVERGLNLFNKKAPFFLTIRSISVLGISLDVDPAHFDNASSWVAKRTFEENVKKLYLE